MLRQITDLMLKYIIMPKYSLLDRRLHMHTQTLLSYRLSCPRVRILRDQPTNIMQQIKAETQWKLSLVWDQWPGSV